MVDQPHLPLLSWLFDPVQFLSIITEGSNQIKSPSLKLLMPLAAQPKQLPWPFTSEIDRVSMVFISAFGAQEDQVFFKIT
jgi:hypothetical protein